MEEKENVFNLRLNVLNTDGRSVSNRERDGIPNENR